MSEIRLNDTSSVDFQPYIRIKDPISALTHFIGFVAAVFASPVLLSKTGLHHSDSSFAFRKPVSKPGS